MKALDFVYGSNPNGGKIIFLGDYIDRGHDNDKVIREVMNPKEGWEFITLMGNHEDMFINNLIYDYHAADQIRNMENFGDVMNWLRNLKLVHIEDENVFAHAFYNDYYDPDQQIPQQCLWDRMSDFEAFENERQGLFLTHGHTPRKHGPVKAPNRVNLDAGAVFYGRLVIGEYRKGVKGPVDFHEFDRYMNK